ncbi:MAG: glutamate-1-semialdehyde 2,1-aminomutase [Desulfurococcales archaeon]|nr:glutamate-1-semialdehyde 2,1-aminomutase [Desulfurococcales archaeon]
MAGYGEIVERARRALVGGVDSPVRALTEPLLVASRGRGPYLYTADGRRLVDYVLGYGPLILGHAHPEVAEAVREQLERGWLYGATTEVEVELAEEILRHVMPGGRVRFVNSGTEATMTAIRLARGYTGRDLIVKFEGCYHGAHDAVLVAAGSAAASLGIPRSPGVPEAVARLTLVAPYNDLATVEELFERHGGEIAAVIVEPVAGNNGVIPPAPGFLEGLRRLTRRYGALLIFDEVITGFRLSLGGAQDYYGVKADLVTLGKIIGGGFPIGAVVGPAEVMEHLTPTGRVFNAGTFNGHPVAMAAGLATLRVLEREGLGRASEAAGILEEAIREALDPLGVEYALNRVESMQQFFPGVAEVRGPQDAARADAKAYHRLHKALASRGVLVPPSVHETIFTSIVHDEEALDHTRRALREAAREAIKP